MKHGFVKVAAATPALRVADPVANAAACAAMTVEAAASGVSLMIFPELCFTGYTCGDLFLHDHLIKGALDALRAYLVATADSDIVSVVGLPIAHADKLYNCAAVCQGGVLLGLVPKTYLPNHSEFNEVRYFASTPEANLTYEFDGSYVQLGARQIFVSTTLPDFRFAVEICEDLLVATPPSTAAAMAGATVIGHLSASPAVVGKSAYRHTMVQSQSARTLTGYIYAGAGEGESSTDGVMSGQAFIYENGRLLAERPDFSDPGYCITEIDVADMTRERRRLNTFSNKNVGEYTEVYFSQTLTDTALTRPVPANPFLPDDPADLPFHCREILSIQTAALKQRVTAAYAGKLVLGISGGLDSTLSLLVSVRAMDALHRPRTDVIAVTMPGFGTTGRTKNNATVLCEELGVDFRCVSIHDAVTQHFKDIGHDPSVRDVTYENAQARERTQVLMDIANDEGGMVIGTGDMSELALGWATYNGDHMSMYDVNGGVPKTVIRHVVAYAASLARADGNTALADALMDVVNTPVSPELLPADSDGNIAQKTEDLVGPYELHDFFLYHAIRHGATPDKLYRLAVYALGDQYSKATILHWLEVFHRRFFTQQFKRSCLSDGPAVYEVSLSPRAGWHMPSDAASRLWMAEIAALKADLAEGE